MPCVTTTRSERAERTTLVDVCASLMDVCHACQADMLDRRGIVCLIDIDSGMLAGWQCDTLGRMVRSLIEQIFCETPDDARGGGITVALHRKGKVWILAVSDEGVRGPNQRNSVHSNQMSVAPSLADLARPLRATVRARPTRSGAVTAVMFAVRSVVPVPRASAPGTHVPVLEAVEAYETRRPRSAARLRIALH